MQIAGAKKIFKSKIEAGQCWSLHGFQTAHFICNQFCCKLWLLLIQNQFQTFISHEEKKWSITAQNLQSIKTLLTLELCQYGKSGSMFSSSEPVAASSDCWWLVRPTEELLQELGSWFCPLNLRLPSGKAFREIARWQAGAQIWTQAWTLQPDQRVVKVLYPPTSQHKLCGVWILFKSWCQIWAKLISFSKAHAQHSE